MLRIHRRYTAGIALSALSLVFAGIVSASAPATAQAAEAATGVTIRVGLLSNAGGATLKGPDGKAITERFSAAIRTGLNEASKGLYTANGEGSKGDDFSLDGDLSQLEGSKGENDGFLCVVRLNHIQNGKSHLVGQWAGTARGLRDLTGNLEKDTRVSNMGLAGELVSRIGKVLAGAAGSGKPAGDGGTTPAVYNALIKNATNLKRLTIDVMPEGASDQKARNTLLPGEKYRLKVSPQDTGAIYILALDSNGKPSSPYAQNEALEGAPGRSVVLPPNSPFTAPKTGVASWVVLLRRENKAGLAAPGASIIAPTSTRFVMRGLPAPGFLVLPGAEENAAPKYGVADTQYGVPDQQYGVPDEPYGVPDTLYTAPDTTGKAPAVFVIGGALGVAPAPAPAVKSKLDDETERILAMMKKDPAGTWVGLEIKLPVVQAGDTKTGAAAPTADRGGVQTPVGVIRKDQ